MPGPWWPALLLAAAFWPSAAAPPPPPPAGAPRWPLQFHASLLQNRSGRLATVDLWFDWPNGRNFNIIHDQQGGTTYDLEWNNGTSFIFQYGATPQQDTCRVLHFDVGILRPNWLQGATRLGNVVKDAHNCTVWAKADFITYYASTDTTNPIYWQFFDGAEFHAMTFEPGHVLPDAKWQAPAACFRAPPPPPAAPRAPGGRPTAPMAFAAHALAGPSTCAPAAE